MCRIQFEVEPNAFRCMVDGWLESDNEKQNWHRLILDIVNHAFAGRSATLVTSSPMEWSVGNSLPCPRSVSQGGRQYLVNELDLCSKGMLAEIAESEEFQRGLLWILAPSTNDSVLLRTVAQIEATALDVPRADEELLLLLDDGRCIHWLSPRRDAEFLQQESAEKIRAQGWPR